MKTKILMVGLFLVSVSLFAQRREIRKAEDANKDGKYQEAKTLLQSVEDQIPSEKKSRQADFYLAKGNAYLGDNGKGQSMEDLKTSVEAFKKAIDLGEKEDGKVGYDNTFNAIINSAVQDQNSKKYSQAANKLYTAYKMSPKDTLYLYYAASNAANAKDYDDALKYYNKLVEMGYTGDGIEYSAKNKKTGKSETFKSKSQRDLYVKSGQYSDPSEKKLKSKVGEITKNLALIYLQKDDKDKAMEAIKKAKKANPDDTSLMTAEANIYYNMGDIEKYSSIIQKVLEKDPENAQLYYNLGVSATQMGAPEKAVGYYKKAVKYDPEMKEAYINMAVATLAKADTIVDQMNKLGMSKADNAKYEKLSEKRKEVYKEAVPYLERAREKAPEDNDIKKTLANVYDQLDKKEKAEALRNE